MTGNIAQTQAGLLRRAAHNLRTRKHQYAQGVLYRLDEPGGTPLMCAAGLIHDAISDQEGWNPLPSRRGPGTRPLVGVPHHAGKPLTRRSQFLMSLIERLGIDGGMTLPSRYIPTPLRQRDGIIYIRVIHASDHFGAQSWNWIADWMDDLAAEKERSATR